jgi:SulP family sulfate permease
MSTASSAARQPAGLGRLGRELVGGVTAAVLAIPVSIGLGIFAYAPLGPHMLTSGISAALIGGCIAPLVCVLLGARSGLIYAPRSVICFMITALSAQAAVSASILSRDLPPDQVALGYLCIGFLVVALGQVFAGLIRLGGAIKYVPFPVMSGFQNSSALLLLLAQIPPLTVSAGAFAVGAGTVIATFYAPRLVARVPGPILGLAAGALLYHVLAIAGVPAGGTIQVDSVPMPSADALGRAPALLGLLDAIDVAVLVITALGVAMVACMDVLLCARVVDQRSGMRSNSHAELLRLGIANAAAGVAGGMPAGVQVGASFANHAAGGKDRVSMLVAGVLSGVALVALQPVLAIMPRAVIAGLLLGVAFQLFDRWTLQATTKLLRNRLLNARAALLDLALMIVVALLALFTHIAIAVVAGVLIAVAVFFARMTRPTIPRAYRCDSVRSRRLRGAAENAILAAGAREILVIELEGPLFFGSAEELARSVEAAARAGARHVILDMRHVTDIDSTGARILAELQGRLAKSGIALAIAHVPPGTRIYAALADTGIVRELGGQRVFADADAAIEWAEDALIAGQRPADSQPELPLARAELFAGLDAAALETVSALMSRREFAAGETVVREGARDRELFIIVLGRATARARLGEPAREVRLLTFPAGTAFGEVALVDQLGRSATVTADAALVCWVLGHEDFERLKADHPAIAVQVLSNLAREMAQRLRLANRAICELDA